MGWLGDNPVFLIAIGALILIVFVRISFWVLHMLGTEVHNPNPTDTADIEEYDLRYRCVVCGAEARLTKMAVEDDDFPPLRHCREDMQLVVEASAPEPESSG